MKKRNELSLTQEAMQALTEAVAKAVENHRRRGIPLAVWRNGRAVSIPATEASALRETPIPYRTRPHGRKGW
ncbi:MAG: hypothetical protein AAB676_01560 [Verrucomicrobiota bacterium]